MIVIRCWAMVRAEKQRGALESGVIHRNRGRMDLLTHILVTRVFVGRRPTTLLAGVAADAPFYFTYPWWLLARGELRRSFAGNTWPSPPRWMPTAYHAAHSLPLLFMVATFARLITGRWPSAPARAWLLHILIDIPTHSRKQWAPQFMWPLSHFSVDGVSWAELAISAFRHARGDRTALP